MESISKIPQLVRSLYEIVSELEDSFPDRRFTPDGHLVGSIGEVLAAYYYSLELLPASAEVHDALTEDGRLVQIKATQVKSIGLRSEPDHLLVIRILPNGEFEEVYNGPGDLPWKNAGKIQSNGQRQISLSKLSGLMSKLHHRYIPRKVAS
jgi:hypothetical protein